MVLTYDKVSSYNEWYVTTCHIGGVMPSQTFFHLTKEKQEMLLQAAKKEFGRVSYAEASINRIIRDSNIARGSFYLYFEDKEDLYFYLLDSYKEKYLDAIIEEIVQKKGDFLKGVISLYDRIVVYCKKNQDDNFFRNVFLNMRYSMEKKYKAKEPPILEKGFRSRFLKAVDANLYRLAQEDLFEAFALAMMITMSAVVYRFMNDGKEDERNCYLKRMSILQYGIYREKE